MLELCAMHSGYHSIEKDLRNHLDQDSHWPKRKIKNEVTVQAMNLNIFGHGTTG